MVSGGPSTEAGTAKRDIYFYGLESACSHRGPTTATLTHLSPTQDPPTYQVACPQNNTSWNILPDMVQDQSWSGPGQAPKRLSWVGGGKLRVTEGTGDWPKENQAPRDSGAVLTVHIM